MARDYGAWLDYFERRSRVPFAWTQPDDCVSVALGAVKALTGRDVLAELGLAWTSLREAKAAIESVGGLETAFNAHFRRVAPAMAGRGDLAGVPDEVFGITILTVEGASLVGPGERGPIRLSRTAMTTAWSAADV